jgi:deoxyribonuclease-4
MTPSSTSSAPPLGAHVSTAGGLATAFPRAARLGCEAFQIFVKSPNQWRAKPLAEPDVRAWREAHASAGAPSVVAHAAYLINLAATSPAFLAQSRAGLADELDRATRLGLDGVVVHPGAHLGAGVDAGLTAVAASIDAILGEEAAGGAGDGARILLELTAGQGSALGWRLEELAAIRARTKRPARVAFCLDTCHAFAAGYDLATPSAVEGFLAEVERHLGLDRIACIHLNDSVHPLGSRKDRHAHIGEGTIPLAGFRRLLEEPRLARVPMVLETDPGEDGVDHARDLATLRGLLGAVSKSTAGAKPKPEAKPRPAAKEPAAAKRATKRAVAKKGGAAPGGVSSPRASAKRASTRRSRGR